MEKPNKALFSPSKNLSLTFSDLKPTHAKYNSITNTIQRNSRFTTHQTSINSKPEVSILTQPDDEVRYSTADSRPILNLDKSRNAASKSHKKVVS